MFSFYILLSPIISLLRFLGALCFSGWHASDVFKAHEIAECFSLKLWSFPVFYVFLVFQGFGFFKFGCNHMYITLYNQLIPIAYCNPYFFSAICIYLSLLHSARNALTSYYSILLLVKEAWEVKGKKWPECLLPKATISNMLPHSFSL